jgi:hypothetical protein
LSDARKAAIPNKNPVLPDRVRVSLENAVAASTKAATP